MIFTQEAPLIRNDIQESPASDRIGILKMLVFGGEGKIGEPGENPLGAE